MYVMALDQGTTSSRAIVFNEKGEIVAKAQNEFTQIYPQAGWVEHNPMEILGSQLQSMSMALASGGLIPQRLRLSASQISEKPQLYGIKKQVCLFITPLCGSAEERLIFVKS